MQKRNASPRSGTRLVAEECQGKSPCSRIAAGVQKRNLVWDPAGSSLNNFFSPGRMQYAPTWKNYWCISFVRIRIHRIIKFSELKIDFVKVKCFAAWRQNVLSRKVQKRNASPRSGIRLVAEECHRKSPGSRIAAGLHNEIPFFTQIRQNLF